MNKIIFLDRDGVVNRYPGNGKYITSQHDFKLIPGAIAAIKKMKKANFKIFIISNQSGVSKKLYSEKTLQKINQKLKFLLWLRRTSIDGIYYCTHQDKVNCLCRKPKIGLLKEAVSSLNEKPGLSFFIGDSFLDMQTGKKFQAKTILLLSGKEKIKNRPNWGFEPDYIFDNLLLAANFLLNNYA